MSREDWKAEIRALVEIYYDVQKVRVGSYNRTLQIASYKKIPGVDDESAAKKEKAVNKWLGEYLGESNPLSLEKVENSLAKRINATLVDANLPIYYDLQAVKGIGPILAAGLLAYFDPVDHWSMCSLPPKERCKPAEGYDKYGKVPPCEHSHMIMPKHPSSFWAYAGLDVVNEQDGDGNITSSHARKRQHGVQSNWNTKVKTLLWKVSDSFIKQRTPIYRIVYDRVKEREMERLKDTEKGWKGHADARARRAMEKRFLADFWEHYRKSLGLPVSDPYVLEKLGHKRDDLGDGIAVAVSHRLTK
ncbi:MAG: hypothetical protein QXR73_02970 [Candidatus Micrarchaeaceae archaeon]